MDQRARIIVMASLLGCIAALMGATAIAQPPPDGHQETEQQTQLVSAGWALEKIFDGERTVAVRHRAGGCYSFHHTEVEEGPDTVTITVWLQRPAGPVTCPPPTTTALAEASLSESLGDRELRHAPANPNTPVEEPPRSSGRMGGASRMHTAVAISQERFREGSEMVFLARADEPADAVAGGVLIDGPILLVPSCAGVPTVVAEEIARLDPDQVIALGGSAAVCEATLAEAAAY